MRQRKYLRLSLLTTKTGGKLVFIQASSHTILKNNLEKNHGRNISSN